METWKSKTQNIDVKAAMSIRTVRLDEETEKGLEQIVKTTQLSIYDTLQRASSRFAKIFPRKRTAARALEPARSPRSSAGANDVQQEQPSSIEALTSILGPYLIGTGIVSLSAISQHRDRKYVRCIFHLDTPFE
jgi:hypothetical protein